MQTREQRTHQITLQEVDVHLKCYMMKADAARRNVYVVVSCCCLSCKQSIVIHIRSKQITLQLMTLE